MYLGGNHWWVARRSLPPDMKFRSVFFCFVVCVVSCLFPTACYCRILRFLSCLIYWNAKKCSVFLASRSPVHSCTFFFFAHLSCDTSCDRVRPMKTFLDWLVNQGGSSFLHKILFNFVRNFLSSSCFYQSGNHGLMQSFHQAFSYVVVTRSKCKIASTWLHFRCRTPEV